MNEVLYVVLNRAALYIFTMCTYLGRPFTGPQNVLNCQCNGKASFTARCTQEDNNDNHPRTVMEVQFLTTMTAYKILVISYS